jgi:hypothetical protein
MQTMKPHDEFKLSLARVTRRRFLGSVGAVGAGVVGAAALRIDPLLVEVTPSWLAPGDGQ